MAKPPRRALAIARSDPRTRTALLLEAIALRHQIAVLKRRGTGCTCFRLWDRLFWILPARWWPSWRDSLVIRPARNGLALAPQRLVRAVAIPLAWSLARRAATHRT
jgi:hypothetical protein